MSSVLMEDFWDESFKYPRNGSLAKSSIFKDRLGNAAFDYTKLIHLITKAVWHIVFLES